MFANLPGDAKESREPKWIFIRSGQRLLFQMSDANPVNAADAIRPFVAIRLGGIFNEDNSVNDTTYLGRTLNAQTTLKTKVGYALGGAAGVEFGRGRVELELLWQKSRVDQDTINFIATDLQGRGTPHTYGLSGDFEVITCLANGYLTLPVEGPIIPFVTAGVGIARGSVDQFDVSGQPMMMRLFREE